MAISARVFCLPSYGWAYLGYPRQRCLKSCCGDDLCGLVFDELPPFVLGHLAKSRLRLDADVNKGFHRQVRLNRRQVSIEDFITIPGEVSCIWFEPQVFNSLVDLLGCGGFFNFAGDFDAANKLRQLRIRIYNFACPAFRWRLSLAEGSAGFAAHRRRHLVSRY